MATFSMPPTIHRFVEAVQRGDTAAFLRLFAEDALVEDWGRRFQGLVAICAWSDEELIGARGRIDVSRVSHGPGFVALDVDWRSDFYSGESRFVFVLTGEKIRTLTIPAR